jgi:hypothetical protein
MKFTRLSLMVPHKKTPTILKNRQTLAPLPVVMICLLAAMNRRTFYLEAVDSGNDFVLLGNEPQDKCFLSTAYQYSQNPRASTLSTEPYWRSLLVPYTARDLGEVERLRIWQNCHERAEHMSDAVYSTKRSKKRGAGNALIQIILSR